MPRIKSKLGDKNKLGAEALLKEVVSLARKSRAKLDSANKAVTATPSAVLPGLFEPLDPYAPSTYMSIARERTRRAFKLANV